MSIRLGALEDALIDAGTRPELATKAAEELANYERDIAGIKTDLNVLKALSATIVGLVMFLLGGMVTAVWKLADISASIANVHH